MDKKLSLNLSLGAVFLGLLLFFTPSAKAQTNYIWNNSSSSWTTSTSWSPSWTAQGTTSAQTSNIAVFSNTVNAFTTVDLSANRTVEEFSSQQTLTPTHSILPTIVL